MIDLDLLERIYDVALGESSWDDITFHLKEQFAAENVVLFDVDEGTGQPQLLSLTGGDDRMWRDYAGYYCTIDPWSQLHAAGGWPSEVVVAGERYLPYRTFVKTEYFQDWWRPNGMYFAASGRFRTGEGVLIQLSLPRSKGGGPFDEKETETLTLYARHIARAVALQAAVKKRSPQPDFDRLALAYGLTPAESRLLEVFAQTGSLRRSSDRLRRSYNTVRSQLRAIMHKTGVTSQVQLMRLIYQGSLDNDPSIITGC